MRGPATRRRDQRLYDAPRVGLDRGADPRKDADQPSDARAAKGDYDAAIEDLSESITLAPEMASTFVLRGNIRQAKGDAAQATGDYNQAIRRDPNSADAYIRRGAAFGATHQFERAVQDFDIALKFQPKDRNSCEPPLRARAGRTVRRGYSRPR